ncbi:MAG: CBS domain-containing protein, partial [Alphaproteobacteria bacterium]
MPISDVMTADVSVVRSDQSIRDAARLMADLDVGVVPVGENDRLVGMLTDRDITVRAVAAGKGPDTPIREAMTTEVRYCYADEDCAAVAQTMGELQIRRLPVLD